MEGGIPQHLSKRKVYFGDQHKKLGIGDEIGNLLEHLPIPEEYIFSIGERDE